VHSDTDAPDDDPPDPPIDLAMVLIAELHRAGLFKGDNLENMARRLREADLPDLADRVEALPLSNLFDSPEMRRSTMHSVTAVTAPTDET
jgi:hypothetical protein